jgi:ribosomal protein S18 acetylase RimI-like enzyme
MSHRSAPVPLARTSAKVCTPRNIRASEPEYPQRAKLFLEPMIRPIVPEDTESLIALAGDSGLFSPEQLATLRPMVSASLKDTSDSQPFWITDDDDGLVGLAYCEPERMTEGTWNLQLIAVHPNHQRQGRGARILRHLEQMLVARGARMLLVDTSGTPDFQHVRAFYRKHGFDEEARIREFYAPGADKVIFRRALSRSTFQTSDHQSDRETSSLGSA